MQSKGSEEVLSIFDLAAIKKRQLTDYTHIFYIIIRYYLIDNH